MKIAIDARFFGPEGTGIGRYVENLLNELVKIDTENEYVVLLRKNNYPLFNPESSNFKKVLTDAKWYSVKEQVVVPAVLTREKPDLVHFPHLNVPLLWGGKFVVTVHDTTTNEFGGSAATTRMKPIYFVKSAGYKIVANQAVKRASKILVPSEFIKKKVAASFGVKPSKIEVTYEAADQIFLSLGEKKVAEGQKKKVLESFGVRDPYLLYVGNLFPYKNIQVIFEALRLLEPKTKLVIVGARNRFTEKVQEEVKDLGLEDRVKFVGFVPNEELVILFQEALAFVFPSLSEGFGLPGLEAMACLCPVIAAKISSLPEVYATAAVYFDPHKPPELAKKVKEVAENKKLREGLTKAGQERVRQFSWRKMAEQTLAVYNQVGKKS
ncbi:MAG: glycosyltransferase family 1 protein [bacterium]|nr:glycosyltransferase family 1 protein [bacterium]